MKYALVFGLVLVVLWVWRASRRARSSDRDAAPKPQNPQSPDAGKKATEIVACEFCRVHLPRQEALTGGRGFYCSAGHRQQAGD